MLDPFVPLESIAGGSGVEGCKFNCDPVIKCSPLGMIFHGLWFVGASRGANHSSKHPRVFSVCLLILNYSYIH